MKSDLHFTVKKNVGRNELLDEALEIIAYADVRLGEEKSSEAADAARHRLIDRISQLKKEQIRFSPKLDVRIVDAVDFQNSGKNISLDLQAKMQEYDFYQVNIPVTLKSRVGWAFTRLECEIQFCEEDTNSTQCPVVYDMFPKDKWLDVLKSGIDCTVTLNENMQFDAQIEKRTEPAQVQAGVTFQAKSKSYLTFGPFRYRLRRPKIKTRGKLDTVCFWQMDGRESVDEENVLLGVMLMVPKKRTRPVNAAAAAIAYHDFQFFTADIFRDYFKEFDDKLKNLFTKGVPLEAHSCWEDFLPQ